MTASVNVDGLADVSRILSRHRGSEVVIRNSCITFVARKNFMPYSSDASTEVKISNIPEKTSLGDLVPIFQRVRGLVYLCVTLDNDCGVCGNATAIFRTAEEALQAEECLDGVLVFRRFGDSSGTKLKVKAAMGCRIYVANIPKHKQKDDLLREFGRIVRGIKDVILYTLPGKSVNRGFCFVEFASARLALLAKNDLSRSSPWGSNIITDWADPEQEPNEDVMNQVRILYLKGLTDNVSESLIKETYESFGLAVEHVKKIRDFAFVHFFSREDAVKALDRSKNLVLDNINVAVTWAKPPPDKQHRLERLVQRERRMRECFNNKRDNNMGGDFHLTHQAV